ncbi:MAG: glycosyltransferase 2 family protein, partial [Pseudonocardiales bacterium]|nr:glycosyltransferase 2 family protein [Pseudonocardiales bacterium]
MRPLLRVGGILIGLLAISLCLRTIAGEWHEIRHAIATADPLLMLLGLLASVAGMSFLAVLWRSALIAFGQRISVRHALAWYFAGELGKYLPGGVWQVVGRGELAVRGGVRRSVG